MRILRVTGLVVGMALLAGCGHHGRCAQSTAPPAPPPQVVIVQVPAGSTVNAPTTATPTPPPAK